MAFGNNKFKSKLVVLNAYRYNRPSDDGKRVFTGVKARCLTSDALTGADNAGNEIVEVTFPYEQFDALRGGGLPALVEVEVEATKSRFNGQETIRYNGTVSKVLQPLAVFA